MPRQPFHVLISSLIREPGFVGMNAQRRVNEIVFLRQSNSAVHLRGPIAVADSNNSLHPSLASPGNYRLAIGVEPLAIEMRVRIDKHGAILLVSGNWKMPGSYNHPQKGHRDPTYIVKVLMLLSCLKNPQHSATAAKAAIQKANRESAICPLKSRAAALGMSAKYIRPKSEIPPEI